MHFPFVAIIDSRSTAKRIRVPNGWVGSEIAVSESFVLT